MTYKFLALGLRATHLIPRVSSSWTPTMERLCAGLGCRCLNAATREFKQKVAGEWCDRDVISRVQEPVRDAGFSRRWTRGLVVHSDIRDRKYLMYMFMRAVAEFDHGSPVPQGVSAELDAWALDPLSYLQYGLNASLFAKVMQEGV